MSSDMQGRETKSVGKHSSSWRQMVLSRVTRERAELDAALLTSADPRRRHVEDLLHRAESVAGQPPTLRGWLNGAQELAYMSIHEADAELAGLLTDKELIAHANDLLTKVPGILPSGDRRVKAVADVLNKTAAPPPAGSTSRSPIPDPALVAHLTRALYDASDERYVQSLTYRNRLIRLTLMALAALGLLITVFAVNAIPLPIQGTPAPSHIRTALLVALFGAVGAFITTVPTLARVTGTWNPFSLPLYQMLLKVALGPVFAIVGVLLLQAHVIPNVQFPMPLTDLLIWALGFGAAQQAVTRAVDNRVAGMVSGDAGGQQADGTSSRSRHPTK